MTCRYVSLDMLLYQHTSSSSCDRKMKTCYKGTHILEAELDSVPRVSISSVTLHLRKIPSFAVCLVWCKNN